MLIDACGLRGLGGDKIPKALERRICASRSDAKIWEVRDVMDVISDRLPISVRTKLWTWSAFCVDY